MAWDDAPPSKEELAASTTPSWAAEPPTQEELSGPQERPWYAFDPRNMAAGFAEGLHKIDSVTGAPIRKFVTESLSGKDLDHAPSGAEQAKMMGASDMSYGDMYNAPSWVPGRNISPADVYGVGLEAIQDPLLLASEAVQGAKGLTNLVRGSEGAEAASAGSRQAARGFQSQAADSASETTAKMGANVSGGDLSVEQGGKLFDYKAPQSLQELRDWKPEPGAGELIGKDRLKEIESQVPDLETKPLNYHYDMMDNPKAMKELKLQFENLPTEDAKKIAAYNQQMVDEAGDKIKSTINGISDAEPRSLSEAGDDLLSSVKEKYQGEKSALGPAFQQLNEDSRPMTRAESMDLARAIADNSKIGKLMKVDPETGKLFLEKNTPRTGMSDQEHNVLSRVVDEMNSGMSFRDVQRTRDFMRKAMDPANPAATAEIGKVRSILLGKLEDLAAKKGPNVGDTFKAYAINERNREAIEKAIGGKIESLDAMYASNPDRVVKKIFANPNYAKVVGDYVGPEQMNKMVAAYIQNGVNKAFDSARGFNPVAIRQWTKTNKAFLDRYASPEVAQRIRALGDYGYYGKRFLDEVNPSGTAASLQAMIEPASFMQKVKQNGFVGAVTGEVASRANAAIKQKQATRTLDEALGGMNPTVADHMKKIMSQQQSEGPGIVNRGIQTQTTLAVPRNFPRTIHKDDDHKDDFSSNYSDDSILKKAQGTKYAGALQNAAKGGQQGLAAANFVLQQRDPEYRKLMMKDANEGQ